MRYLFILSLFLFFACQPTGTKKAELSVEIKDATSEKIVITGFNYKKSLELVEGKALDTLSIVEAGIYDLRLGRNGTKIYLKPGDQIKFTASESDFKNSYAFEGPNDKIQDYLKEKTRVKNKLLAGREIYKMSPEDFENRINEASDSLNNLVLNSDLPKTFETSETVNMKLQKQRMKYIYPAYTDSKREDLSDFFQDALSETPLTDEPLYLSSEEYRELVNDHFSISVYTDTTDTYEKVFMGNIVKLKAGNIRDQLLFKDMQYMMGPNEELEGTYKFFKDYSQNASHLAKMTENYEAFQKLALGEESPGFDYENYKGGNTSLKDLSGKYVYVDVWATWCGPCKAEIPHLKSMEKKFHGKDIEFVSISIDNPKDHEKWKNMVEEKELTGSQLFADNAWESSFVTDYMIKGIPRFILIDPNGKIVSADAPRPSDEKLEKTLKNLNI